MQWHIRKDNLKPYCNGVILDCLFQRNISNRTSKQWLSVINYIFIDLGYMLLLVFLCTIITSGTCKQDNGFFICLQLFFLFWVLYRVLLTKSSSKSRFYPYEFVHFIFKIHWRFQQKSIPSLIPKCKDRRTDRWYYYTDTITKKSSAKL